MKKLLMFVSLLSLFTLQGMEHTVVPAHSILDKTQKALAKLVKEKYNPFYDAEIEQLLKLRPRAFDPEIGLREDILQEDIAERTKFVELLETFQSENTKIQDLFEQALCVSSIKDLYAAMKSIDDFYLTKCEKYFESACEADHYVKMSDRIGELFKTLYEHQQ